MALSLAAHFAGYEFARNAALALFTSERTGFGGGEKGGGGGAAWALPLAVGCVAPFSVALLWLYTLILDKRGPRYALRSTTVLFASVLFVSGFAVPRTSQNGNGKYIVFGLFVYQNASVQLLCNQHWGYLGSVLTAREGSTWFAPVAGLGSISSALAAGNVSKLVERVGLNGLLYLGGWTVLLSAWFADGAYEIAEEHGFAPAARDHGGMKKTKTKTKPKKKSRPPGREDDDSRDAPPDGDDARDGHGGHGGGIVGLARRASRLFRRVPVLGALFVEVLLSQSLSSLLNYLFLTGVRDAVPDDSARAGWTGSCYAWINGISGAMQFGALPAIMRLCGDDPRWVWMVSPVAMAFLTLMASWKGSMAGGGRPSLFWIGAPFLAMKTIEYSLRSFAVEMLYVSLDYESRFVGKEVIGLFANRIGKSTMAVVLALIAASWGDESEIVRRRMRLASFVVALGWMCCSLRLRRLLPPKKKKGGGKKTHPA